ncbi:hypothetical protein ACIBCT_17380 [Streptosporangium sp. NPDC050855]|uniref:hypothetical protein n=1 Tax=Streptosporangium sp. NPDC050855 TaxID=3366194 RepID=UPI003788D276
MTQVFDLFEPARRASSALAGLRAAPTVTRRAPGVGVPDVLGACGVLSGPGVLSGSGVPRGGGVADRRSGYL